jgi:hypothetical protein
MSKIKLDRKTGLTAIGGILLVLILTLVILFVVAPIFMSLAVACLLVGMYSPLPPHPFRCLCADLRRVLCAGRCHVRDDRGHGLPVAPASRGRKPVLEHTVLRVCGGTLFRTRCAAPLYQCVHLYPFTFTSQS